MLVKRDYLEREGMAVTSAVASKLLCNIIDMSGVGLHYHPPKNSALHDLRIPFVDFVHVLGERKLVCQQTCVAAFHRLYFFQSELSERPHTRG